MSDPPSRASSQVEWEVEQIQQRLKDGATTFSALRDSVAELKDEIRPKPIRLALGLVGAFTAVLGVVWAAARYPDREEFDAARRKTEDKLYDLDRRSIEAAGEQQLIKRDVADIAKGQAAIEDKLDRALAPTTKRRQP
jgi:hypothetical protein